MTYAALQADVAAYSHRSDLTALITGFIAKAEALLFRELTSTTLEDSATGTTSGATISLPTDYNAILRVELTHNSTKFTLDYASPNGIESLTQTPGVPCFYTLEGNAIRLLPEPADNYQYAVLYEPKLSALSDSNTSNWLLDVAPDLYLVATLAEVGRYTRNQELVAEMQAQIPVLMDSVKRQDRARKFPKSGGLQIRPRRM